MSAIKLGHINLYAGNKTPKRALEVVLGYKPHSVGINEGYPFVDHIIPTLAAEHRYRMFYGRGGSDQRRGFKDTPVLTRKSLASLGEIAIFGCASSLPIRIAPMRGITATLYKYPVGIFGQVAHINVHPHAAVAGLDAKQNDRAAKYNSFMMNLKKLIKLLQSLGFDTFVTGDVNLHVDQTVKNCLTPWHVFEQTNLKYKSTGLDAIAFPFNMDLAKFEVIPHERTGSDHDAFIATVK